jgi:hypothetical protein
LDIEGAFDRKWHSGLLYKLSELASLTSLIKLIPSFLTNRRFKVLAEDEFSTPKNIAAGEPQGSFRAPILYARYLNDAPMAPGTHLTLLTDDACISTTEKHEHLVLCKLQCSLTAVKSWCEQWNIKIQEGKTQVIYFFRKLIVLDDMLQVNGWHNRFVNTVTYLGVIFDRRMAWRRSYRKDCNHGLQHLSTNIKLTLYKALIMSVMAYTCAGLEYAMDVHPLKIQHLENRVPCATGNLDRRTLVQNCMWLSKFLKCTTT